MRNNNSININNDLKLLNCPPNNKINYKKAELSAISRCDEEQIKQRFLNNCQGKNMCAVNNNLLGCLNEEFYLDYSCDPYESTGSLYVNDHNVNTDNIDKKDDIYKEVQEIEENYILNFFNRYKWFIIIIIAIFILLIICCIIFLTVNETTTTATATKTSSIIEEPTNKALNELKLNIPTSTPSNISLPSAT